MSENTNAVLFGKMAKVMGQLKRLKKTGHNKYFNYDFATDADVSDTIRELLSQENIGLFASMPDYEQTIVGENSNKKPEVKTVVHLELTLACGDSGGTFTTHWYGEAIASDDKGINKAATAGVKYWLMKTFLLSTGDSADDPDNDGEYSEGSKPAKKQAQKPQNNAPAQPKGQITTSASKTPETGTKRVFAVTQLETALTKEGKPYYRMTATDNTEILTFSRELFRSWGWEDTLIDSMSASGFKTEIQTEVEALETKRKDGKGMVWMAVIPSNEVVIF